MRDLKICVAAAVAAAALTAVSVIPSQAAAARPVAGKQIRFPHGYWAGLPQLGPDRKVRQCVLVAMRPRKGPGGGIDSVLGINIGRGAGLSVSLLDDALPSEPVLDDQAALVLDGGRAFPAVGFTLEPRGLALHPGDAPGFLAALAKSETLTVRFAGAGVDSGPLTLELPGAALAWLTRCGKTFHIAIDRPSDPDAPALPVARPRSPAIGPAQWTKAGPPGIEDKQKISGWDASELRDRDGKIIVCMIRRHYVTGSERDSIHLATFFMVSRAKGLMMMLKSSSLDLPPGQPVEITRFTVNGKPFDGLTAGMLSRDEIGIYPKDAKALARALDHGVRIDFKSKVSDMEAPVQSDVMPWLRACARRNAIAFGP